MNAPAVSAQVLRGSGDAELPAAASLPALRADLQLLAAEFDARGTPVWKLYDPARNQFFKLGWLQFECLQRWRQGTAAALLQAVRAETALTISADDIDALCQFLVDNELLQVSTANAIGVLEEHRQRGQKRWWMHLFTLTLYHRVPLFQPDPLLARLHACCKPLLTANWLIALLLAASVALLSIVSHWYDFTDSFVHYFTPSGVLAYLLVLVAINVLHELGHGIAAHHYGCKVPRMGIALVFLLPLFYSDTTDSWRLRNRRQRLLISAAGMLTEAVLAVFATFMWLLLPDGLARTLAYFVAATSWAMTLLVNLNPFMKFDGYFLLADALAVDNLQTRSFANLRWQLRKMLLGVAQPMPFMTTANQHQLICAYAIGAWLYRLFLYMGIAWLVYTFWFKALGIVMMAGVLALLLFKPVIQELRNYHAIVKRGQASKRRWLSLALLLGVALLCIVPLPSKVVAPAVLSSAESARVYSPRPAQVAEIHVSEGHAIRKGDVLVTLSDPELVYQQQSLQREITALQSRLEHEQAWQNTEGFEQISRQELDSKRAALDSVSEQINSLRLRSPVNGQLVMLAPWLRTGSWIGANEVIAELANNESVEVRAYVAAVDRQRVLQQPARFYAADGSTPQRLRLENLSIAAVPVLEDQSLAVSQGGSIAVSVAKSGALVPRKDWLRAILSAEDSTLSVSHEQTGYVMLPAASSSMLWRALQRVYGVILRESGF